MVDRKTFEFEVTTKKFLTFNSKEVKTDLTRWDLGSRISLTTFTYNNFFKDYQAKDFAYDFFNDPTVQASLKVYRVLLGELSKSTIPYYIQVWRSAHLLVGFVFGNELIYSTLPPPGVLGEPATASQLGLPRDKRMPSRDRPLLHHQHGLLRQVSSSTKWRM